MIEGGPRPWEGADREPKDPGEDWKKWGICQPPSMKPNLDESNHHKEMIRRDPPCVRSPAPEERGEGGKRYKVDSRITNRSRKWAGKTVYSGWSNEVNPHFADLEKINDDGWVERVAASYTEEISEDDDGKPYTEDRHVYRMDAEDDPRPRRGKTTDQDILGKDKAKRLKDAEKINKVAKKRNSRYQAKRREKREYLNIRRIDRLYAVLKSRGLVVPSGPLTYLNILNTNKYILKREYEKNFGKIHRNKFNQLIIMTADRGEKLLSYYMGDDFFWSKFILREFPLQIAEINGRDCSSHSLMYQWHKVY